MLITFQSSNVMILIKSGRNSFSDRFQLRRILNSSSALSNFAFFIGTATQNIQHENNLLQMEMKEYDDIIVADFHDTYENLPLKTKSMYKFANDYCIKETLISKTPFSLRKLPGSILKSLRKTINDYLMIDSDVLLAENAAQLIHEAQNFNRTSESSLQMVCLRPSKGLHGTIYHGKYFKSIEMYAPSQMPAYCNGQATFLSRVGKLKFYFCHQVFQMISEILSYLVVGDFLV